MSDRQPPDPNEMGWVILWCMTLGLAALTLALLVRACSLAGKPHL